MTWTSIRSYFNARCEEQGLKEWTDAFNTDDIPSTILDSSYHVAFATFSGEKQNQLDAETLVEVEIQIFVRGFATPKDAVDSIIAKAEAIVIESLKPSKKLGQTFKNVLFTNMTVEPLAEENDNVARAKINFEVRDNLQTC